MVKYINVSNGERAAVDDEFFDILQRIRWFYRSGDVVGYIPVYVRGSDERYRRTQKVVKLSGYVFLLAKRKYLNEYVEHIDGDPLNYQINNLVPN